MNTVILILAASNPWTKWNRQVCRQLLDINGEPLLMRTLRQLAELGYGATVVTNKPEIHAVVPDCFVPEDYKWIVSTMLSTRELWDDKTIILLGDVVWDIYALNLVLSTEEFPTFYGYGNEIFAIAWLREHFGEIEKALKKTGDWMDRAKKRACYANHFYAAFHGKTDLRKYHRVSKWSVKPNWITISPDKSCVMDFDRKEDYEKWEF